MAAEDDEATGPPSVAQAAPIADDADNSLGRLLTLCDGIFAIAMTLLALDLTVPDDGDPAART